MDDRTLGERISDDVAHFGGSWRFIFLFSGVLVVWVIVNTLAIFDFIAFDKHPYILLNLVLSFVAAFQAPFIMMSQNRAERKQDAVYRRLFQELKEMVQQDMEKEDDIEKLSHEIKRNQEIARLQYERLLTLLKQAIELQVINKKELEEIEELILHQEAEEADL